MTYAAFVEHMNATERREFDRKLAMPPPRAARAASPGGGGASRSSGTADLMAAFGTSRR